MRSKALRYGAFFLAVGVLIFLIGFYIMQSISLPHAVLNPNINPNPLSYFIVMEELVLGEALFMVGLVLAMGSLVACAYGALDISSKNRPAEGFS